jgi:L-lactate utilization protein LutC
MLSRVRAALGRDAASEPVEMMPFEVRATSQSFEELLAHFTTEMELVGGHVATAATADEVKSYLDKMVPAETQLDVALSDAEVLREFGIAEFLSAKGLRVVPSLPEFAATDNEQSGRAAKEESLELHQHHLLERYKHALLKARIGITSADYAIAETGSLVLVSGREHHRLTSLLPFIHICLLDARRIVPNLHDLLARINAKHVTSQSTPPAITLITGPSRTADIEHTLITGIHGPNELHVLIYNAASS